MTALQLVLILGIFMLLAIVGQIPGESPILNLTLPSINPELGTDATVDFSKLIARFMAFIKELNAAMIVPKHLKTPVGTVCVRKTCVSRRSLRHILFNARFFFVIIDRFWRWWFLLLLFRHVSIICVYFPLRCKNTIQKECGIMNVVYVHAK